MEKKRPQLNLEELQRIKWLLGGALALFSVWTVFYMEVDAWTLLALNTVGITAVLVRPDLPARLPRWIHYAAFPIIVTLFLADLWFSAEGEILPPMIRLDLMLILYRGVSYRERRDDLQLIVLGLFLVVVGGVLTVSVLFAAQIIAFTACALLLLYVTTLVDAVEATDPPLKTPFFTWGGVAAKPGWAERTHWSRLWPRLRAATDWRVAVLGVVLFAGVVTVSALLFLAIPRFQLENSLFLERFISKKSKTGFSDNIKFGDVTDIMSDDSIALSIDVSDPQQVPSPLYLRMVVLDEYRDGSFKLSTELRRDAGMGREMRGTRIAGTEPSSNRPPVYWTFYLEAGISRYLPIPGSFETLTFREGQNLAASSELRIVALHNEPVSMLAYRVEGVNASAPLRDPLFARRLRAARASVDVLSGPAQKRMQLGLPFVDRDAVVLRRIVSDLSPNSSAITAETFARVATAWLQKNHRYSMRSALPAGEGDPLVRWINSQEPGHCELFAGAFVALARTAGLPARVVSGFRTGTWNGFSNSLSVRNSEAHAWCELWDQRSTSWLRVDPTPGAGIGTNAEELAATQGQQRVVDRSWKARWTSLRIFWYRRIVSFDQRSQLDTIQAMKKATEDRGAGLRARLEVAVRAAKNFVLSPWDVRRAILAVTALIGLAGTWWCARMFIRDWRWRFANRDGAKRHDPVRMEAGRWLVKLAGAESNDPDVLEARERLRRLRFGAAQTWSEPSLVFQHARSVWKKARRSGKQSSFSATRSGRS